jgi:putative DNA primase/helicase
MNHAIATPPKPLLPHHREGLHGRGFTDDDIARCGFYSETNNAKVASLLNRKSFPAKHCPAIVIPYVDEHGRNGFARVRLDKPLNTESGLAKYASPTGVPNQVYLPFGVVEILDNAEAPLILTEGEFKAAAATLRGFKTIGLPGVYGYKPKGKETLTPQLESIAWKRRTVYIAFDSDVQRKPQVQEALARLAAILITRGAVVRVVYLPDGPPDEEGTPTKLGLDDYLVLHGAPAFRKLLDEAQDPPHVDADELKPDGRALDPADTADDFLNGSKIDGVPRLRFWRGAWWLWAKGRYYPLQNGEVAASIVEHANKLARNVTTTVTGNLVNQLRAKSLLPGSTEPPTWLGDAPLDSDGKPWRAADVLVAKNGLVNLAELVLRKPHFHEATPRFFSLAALDYDFAIDAPPPVEWLAFLNQLWPADRDGGKSIATLQEWFGYVLTPDTSLQKILFLIGPKRSGKGTICRIMRAVVGAQNCCGPTLASFGQNFGLWPLLGKSLAIISDARLSGRADQQVIVERLLSISGEDELTIDRKNLEPVTCKLNTRIVTASNELPRLTDSSGALAGRLVLLQMTESFFGKEDTALSEKLLAELPSIALWAVGGWKRLRDRKRFEQPEDGQELLGEMEDISSPIGAFLRDECVIEPAATVERQTLYQAYIDWCKDQGKFHHEDAAGFGRALRARVPTLRSSQPRAGDGRTRLYRGLRLRAEI